MEALRKPSGGPAEALRRHWPGGPGRPEDLRRLREALRRPSGVPPEVFRKLCGGPTDACGGSPENFRMLSGSSPEALRRPSERL
eukprot:15439329-Alexandrium_andersonii.AAC.1